MIPLNWKFFQRIFPLCLLALCSATHVNAETISGTTCVYAGSQYQYMISGINSTRNYQWCVTGGTIQGGSGNCLSGTGYSAYVVYVTWTAGQPTRALTLSWSGGSTILYANYAGTLQAGSITSATSQTINYNTAPPSITCSAASGGVCGSTTYTYQWQSSPNNVNWTNISGATSLNYTSGALTSTTYFRRMVSSSGTGTSAYSNAATVFVNPQFSPGSITSPVSIPITYNTSPGQVTGTAASGGGCSGAYSYQWESSPNNSTYTPVSGATAQNYTPGNLTATIYYRRKASCGTENLYSNVISITVASQLSGGNMSQVSFTVAYNTSPGQVSCPAATGGNCGSGYGYQWESSPDNITYTAITGATSQNYTPGNLTATTCYHRLATCGSETRYSTVATVSVTPLLNPGAASPATIAINYNNSPGMLSGSLPTGGNCANYNYQWESSADNITYTAIKWGYPAKLYSRLPDRHYFLQALCSLWCRKRVYKYCYSDCEPAI
ncbi:MAG: hypothetical protein WDO19_21810 [Bacteroidota bacterium]